jgi:hypothetical protein
MNSDAFFYSGCGPIGKPDKITGASNQLVFLDLKQVLIHTVFQLTRFAILRLAVLTLAVVPMCLDMNHNHSRDLTQSLREML